MENDLPKIYLRKNAKRISRSALTTFEALFMQNAKQTITQKVIKTASKPMF